MGVTMVGRSRAQIVCTNRKGLQILKIRNRNMFEESYNLIRYAEAFYLILGFHQILTGQNLIGYIFMSDQTSSVLNLDPKRDLTQRLSLALCNSHCQSCSTPAWCRFLEELYNSVCFRLVRVDHDRGDLKPEGEAGPT